MSYGAADTAPSPILCKRFFSDRPAFFKEMMEDVSHFGVGLINSGRGKGMAALDGFAATLEVRVTPRIGGQINPTHHRTRPCSCLISSRASQCQEKDLIAHLLFHISYMSLRHHRTHLCILYAMIMPRWITLIGILYLRNSKRRAFCGVIAGGVAYLLFREI